MQAVSVAAALLVACLTSPWCSASWAPGPLTIHAQSPRSRMEVSGMIVAATSALMVNSQASIPCVLPRDSRLFCSAEREIPEDAVCRYKAHARGQHAAYAHLLATSLLHISPETTVTTVRQIATLRNLLR